jgi:hypothetical protein
VTHGVPLYYRPLGSGQPVDLTRPLELLAEKMEQAQIAVYTVQQSLQGAGASLGNEGSQSLDIFTSLTGGRRYISDSAELAIPRARRDSRANYQIAYYTDVPRADHKRHKIRVICTRKDVRVQTEQEYYALGIQAPPEEFKSVAFEDAGKSSLDATEIGVRARVSATIGASSPKDMQFDLQIDTQDLLLLEDKDHYVGKVSVGFAMDDGQVTHPIPLDVNLTKQQYEAAAHGTLLFKQRIEVEPAVNRVRVIVVDLERRAVGSVSIPVTAGRQ